MIGDRELSAFRQDYYALLAALFRREPPAELLDRIAEGMEERIAAGRRLEPLLGEGWEELRRFFTATPAEQLSERVADEFVRLFIGPYGHTVTPYESFYFSGHLMDRPLASLREDLKALGIEKSPEETEPEDFLAFELEVMRWLIARETAVPTEEEAKEWLKRQREFLARHLLVWAPACARDMEAAETAVFYRGAAKMLRGFLELERILFPGGAIDKVASLEEVRRTYGSAPAWKGPTFNYT